MRGGSSQDESMRVRTVIRDMFKVRLQANHCQLLGKHVDSSRGSDGGADDKDGKK